MKKIGLINHSIINERVRKDSLNEQPGVLGPLQWVKEFLHNNRISYDYQTASYEIDGELCDLKTIVSQIRLNLFEDDMLHLKNYVSDALRIIKIEKDKDYLDRLKARFTYQATNTNDFVEIVTAITGKSNELDILVLKHWMWLVKRKLFGLGTDNELMLVIYGPSGSGKSYFLRKLLKPLESVSLYTDMRIFNDQFGLRQFDRNRVMIFDELDMVHEVSVEKLKNVITAQNISWRMIRSESLMKGRQNCSFIATTNLPISEQIKDPTSARRYWQLNSLSRIDWDRVNSVSYEKLWRSVDEHSPSSLINNINQVHKVQNNTVLFNDDVDEWIDLKIDYSPFNSGSPCSSSLFRSFRDHCIESDIKSSLSFKKFCHQLQSKLNNKGFTGELKKHSHNGTVWALKERE